MTSPSSANPGPANIGGAIQNFVAGSPPLGQVINSLLSSPVGQRIGNFLGDGITPLFQPPALRTFVYSPEVKVIIAHNEIQYDVSADVVRCTLIRPENSAATFGCTLQNKDLRYTPLDRPRFSRMDRIVVYMKKTTWTQVFSGYLDSIPYRQLYPGTVDIKATCTVKRLMHTWFNKDLPASSALLNQIGLPGVLDGGVPVADSGLGSLLRNLLIYVGGWRVENIHIQNFPTSFFDFLKSSIPAQQQANAPNVEAFKQMILGSDTTPGPGSYAGSNPNAGTPGPSTPGLGGIPGASGGAADTLTFFYVSQIVAACDERGMGPLVSDNNLSAGLAQAGETGGASGGPLQNPGQQKAWQQVQQTNLDQQQANRNSDAAILGTATAMAETGAGTGIRNLCNPAVPNSDQYANDGPGFGNGVGIFGQPTAAEWGDLAQRMNPKQAAGMFMSALGGHNGWRNMNPGEACAMVQRNNVPGKYEACVQLATTIVQAYRTGQGGTASSVVPGGASAAIGTSATTVASSGVGGAPGMNPNLVTAAASSTPAPTISPGATNPVSTGKPQPDSEGAINWAMTQIGKPYVFGGKGPVGYDCSGLVSAAFKSVGVAVPAQTDVIRSSVQQIPNASVQRGDLVEPTGGHVVLWCGDGTIIEAQREGVPVARVPSWIGPPSSWLWVGRACLNGGVDPSAPFNPPETMGPGTPPGALDQTAGATGVGSSGPTDGSARNLFGLLYQGQFATEIAGQFTGRKAFIDGQPLISMIQAVASAGLRSWSSAPNGDFMAWYPDYWGLDGKPAVLRLEDIELTDVNINFSDDNLTTHVYVAGDWNMMANPDPTLAWLNTAGVVTVENADSWLYTKLIQIAPPDEQSVTGDQIMKRYGIRPMSQIFAMAGQPELELLLAMKVFMEKWAQQYQTDISMTFMPELFPGMRVQLPGKSLQVYVSSVTHMCDYENGFYTQATIMAPSTPMAKKLMSTVNSAVSLSEEAQLGFSQGANIAISPDAAI